MIFPVLVWDFGWVILQIIRRNPSNDTAGEKEAFWRNCRYKATAWCPFSPAKAQEIYHNYLWQRLFAQQAAKPNNFQASQKKKQKRTSGVVGTYDNCCSVNILNIYKKIYKIEKEWLFDDIVLAAQYTMTITTNIHRGSSKLWFKGSCALLQCFSDERKAKNDCLMIACDTDSSWLLEAGRREGQPSSLCPDYSQPDCIGTRRTLGGFTCNEEKI